MKRTTLIGCVALSLLAGCGGGSGSPAAVAPTSAATPSAPVSVNAVPAPAPNALFQVGAATINIDPDTPVNVGGYSDYTQPALQKSNDPLEVRAFVVAKGDKAVAFAVVDSTGWFAEYQDADVGNGQFGSRVDAAQKLAEHGFKVDRSAVMVSTTHSHATPTLVGIWGLMGPANKAYLKKVHDAVVQAVDTAASNLKTSEIWTANGDISSIIWQNGQGTDHVDGFAVDPKMPVLWARDPGTGATNALYVNIPNHPDQFRPFNGSITQGFSADVPGYVRHKMDVTIGGTSVVGSATLGRQESPGANADYAEVSYQGDYVLNALQLAMANAAPLKGDTIASAETLVPNVTVGSSQDNQNLLGLMKFNAVTPGYSPGPNCSLGTCTVPRALAAPWCTGNCTLTGSGSTTSLATYTTALRIGPLLYVSNPGESFAEVNDTLRGEVLDAQSVNVVGLAGDFLGYNWTPADYTATEFGSSDFSRYNIGPDLAQRTADSAYANAIMLGFKVKPAADVVHAAYNSSVAGLPGIQFYSTQVAATPSSISFYGSTAQPQNNYKQTNHALSTIAWDFGDNSGSVTSNSQDRLSHAFTTPGTYNVTAKVTDGNTGNSRSWSQTLTILPPFSVAINSVVSDVDTSKTQLTLAAIGGQGKLLAARWTCPDGQTPQGLIVTCNRLPRNGVVQVTAWDGAGNSATSQNQVP